MAALEPLEDGSLKEVAQHLVSGDPGVVCEFHSEAAATLLSQEELNKLVASTPAPAPASSFQLPTSSFQLPPLQLQFAMLQLPFARLSMLQLEHLHLKLLLPLLMHLQWLPLVHLKLFWP
jgi:hypothetical protein